MEGVGRPVAVGVRFDPRSAEWRVFMRVKFDPRSAEWRVFMRVKFDPRSAEWRVFMRVKFDPRSAERRVFMGVKFDPRSGVCPVGRDRGSGGMRVFWGGSGLGFGVELFAQTGLLLAEFRGEGLAEILLGEDGADLQFGYFAGHGVGAAAGPGDGVFHGVDLPDPEAGEELFGFGEGTVDDGGFASCH